MELQKHSGFGIASFITSIVSAVVIFSAVVAAGIIMAKSPAEMGEGSPTAIIIGLIMIAFLFAALVALGFGIGGLFQKERRKIFPILGVIISSVSFICTALLMVIGLAMK